MSLFSAGLFTYLALIVAIGAQTLFLLRQIVRRDRVLTVLAVCLAGDLALLTLGAAGLGAVAERWPALVPALTVAGVVYLVWFAMGALRSALRGGRTLSSAAVESSDDGLVPDRLDVAALTGELPLIDPETGRVAQAWRGGGGPSGGGPAPAGAVQGDGGSSVAVKQRVGARVEAGPSSRAQTPLVKAVLLALSVSLVNPHAILDTVVMMGTFAQAFGADKWLYIGGAATASVLWFTLLGWGGTRLAPYMDSARTWRVVDGAVGVLMLGIAVKVALTLL